MKETDKQAIHTSRGTFLCFSWDWRFTTTAPALLAFLIAFVPHTFSSVPPCRWMVVFDDYGSLKLTLFFESIFEV